MKTKLKKVIVLFVLLMLGSGFASLSFANQDNHGQKVSEIAKSTEPGPQHGKTVSEAARNKSQNDYALSFDGVNDYVTIPHNDKQNVGKNFAVEFWAKMPTRISNPYPNNYVMSKNVRGFNGWQFVDDLPEGRIQGSIAEIDTWRDLFVYPKIGNEWHHVALVKNSDGVIALYVNGVKEAQNTDWTNNYAFNEQPIWIGATQLGFFTECYIDEVRIWNKNLTQEEIQANMFKEIKPQEGLVGYWQFDEGSGGVAKDSSGNGNDGILVNGPTWTTDTPF